MAWLKRSRKTGWIDIAPTLPGYVSGTLQLKRAGDLVWLNAYQLVVADQGTAWANLGNVIPAGYRISAAGFVYLAVTPWVSNRATGPVRISAGGNLLVYGMSGQKPLDGLVSWPTDDMMPAGGGA